MGKSGPKYRKLRNRRTARQRLNAAKQKKLAKNKAQGFEQPESVGTSPSGFDTNRSPAKESAQRSYSNENIHRRKQQIEARNVSDSEIPSTPTRKRKLADRNPELHDMKGRRLLTTECINSIVQQSVNHCKTCANCDLKLEAENQSGLSSSLKFTCSCGFFFWDSTDSGRTTLPANEASVWAVHSAGIGYAALKTAMQVFEVPMISFPDYKLNENIVYEDFQRAKMQHLLENGREELRLAIEAKDYIMVEGKNLPFTMVQVDGGWGKRSYGHGYNAKCGVGVIIGMRTKKILWMDTRNNGCYQCTVNSRRKKMKFHRCYKNWNRSSAAMESSIIVEGFKRSIEMHGLVYKQMIGDGDSAVFADVQFLYQGIQVEKIECVNHFMRNLTKKIISIKENKIDGKFAPKIPPFERKIIATNQEKITIGVRKAIEYNSINRPATSVQTLVEDIENVLFHVFGEHTRCKAYFCNKTTADPNPLPKIVKYNFWTPLRAALNRGVVLASRLIHNCLSNDAEHFMALCAKYISGKRVYYGHRNGYNMRMISAMFAFDDCSFWARTMYKTIHDSSPSTPWSISHGESYRRKQYIAGRPTLRAKRNLFDTKKTASSAENSDYGPNCRDADIDECVMQVEVTKLFGSLQVTQQDRDSIEQETRRQSEAEAWFVQRRGRITASCAKQVYKLQDSTDNKGTLNSLLYPSSLDKVPSIQYGKINEPNAIIKYSSVTGQMVRKCGLIVSMSHGILGASPDGIVGADGLIEVKCPIVLDGKNPEDYDKVCGKAPFLRRDKTGSYQLIKSHQYYYQIIMTLHVTERDWCDLVVWTPGPKREDPSTNQVLLEDPLGKCLIIRVLRSDETSKIWASMVKKFSHFWYHDMAPELVDSRKSRQMPFRLPPYRVSAMAEKKKKLEKKVVSPASACVRPPSPMSAPKLSASTPSSSTLSCKNFVPPPTYYSSDSDTEQ